MVPDKEKKKVHELLRKMFCSLSSNVLHAEDDTFKAPKAIKNNKDIAVLPGDKNPTVVIMNKKNYVDKVQGIIDEGIFSCKYTTSVDTIIKDLACSMLSHTPS